MDITHYVSREGDHFRFTEGQASDFAKAVAGDFNPIHDVGFKRFCVPGDLLFSLLLHHYGVHGSTHVQFAGMLGAQTALVLPTQLDDPLHVSDERGRNCLTLFARGEVSHDVAFIAALAEAYVQFSGKTFPDILVGLMRDEGVMINPHRPLVIYRDMALQLECFTGSDITLELVNAELARTGKKGLARLSFSVLADGKAIGEGEKNLVLSGLRDYDEDAMSLVVDEYNRRRAAYRAVAAEAAV